jgi:hypothetical protein
MEASRGGAMRSQAGTVLVEEIQTRTAVVLKPCWEKRSFIDLKRRERRILSAGYRCARWIAAQDDEDIYSLRGIAEQQ